MESRILPRPDVVEEDADFHTACRGPFECPEEHVGRLVPGHDVDLDVDVLVGLIDEFGHALDRGFVVRDHPVAVAGDHRQRGQRPPQLGDGDEFRRGVQRWRHIRQIIGAFVQEFVRFGLDPGAALIDIGAAEQQECGNSDDRHEQDEQQPGRGR